MTIGVLNGGPIEIGWRLSLAMNASLLTSIDLGLRGGFRGVGGNAKVVVVHSRAV